MKPNKSAVGERIKTIRKELGFSMEEFGKYVSDSPRSSVNSWEKGVSIPRLDKLNAIAKLGKTTPQQILYGDFETYAHELINTKLQIRVPKKLEPTLIDVIKEQGVGIGDDVEIQKIMNTLLENLQPANENDYLTYSYFNEFESLFIAYKDRNETATAFVHIDRENNICHFSPSTFSNMSLSRLFIFLTNADLHHYIFNELPFFEPEDRPIIVSYEIESVENKLRVFHLEYSKKKGNYQPVLDIKRIKQIGTYQPFVEELSKERLYREFNRKLTGE